MTALTWGRNRQHRAWLASKPRWRVMWSGHDALFIAAGRYRLRVMKPGRR